MRLIELFAFSLRALHGYGSRAIMMLIATGIGVMSVVLLIALGESARHFVVGELSALGTHLLIVLPGRSETTGGAPPLLGETPRPITLDDALSLSRIGRIRHVAPVAFGSAPIAYRQRERETVVIGSTEGFAAVRGLELRSGRFFRLENPRRGVAVAVIGAKLKRELFGNDSALGHWIRVGERRYRVVGVLAPAGQSIGLDLGDVVILPVASALTLFNTDALFRVLVEVRSSEDLDAVKTRIADLFRVRHDGEDDVTVISQDSVLSTFNKIFDVLTVSVSSIAGISLAVAGVLIMNVMLIAVSQRTSEIGLLMALGATRGTIVKIFVIEAGLLSLAGAALGVLAAAALLRLGQQIYPTIAWAAPWWGIGAAAGVAIVIGTGFGTLPARRAARLNPVTALSRR